MKYRIGELSKILHISDQMIRYYEKCGVIHPERSGEGNYRIYDDMDLFMLYDAIRYKELGINIGSISEMVGDDYYNRLNRHLIKEENNLQKNINYNQMKLERIHYLRKQNQLAKVNIGNFWMDILPSHYIYYSGSSSGDQYGMDRLSPKMSKLIYAPENIIFFDPCVEYDQDGGTWWYSVRREIHDALNIKDDGRYRCEEEKVVLCTVIDMGQPGTFAEDNLIFVNEYLDRHHLVLMKPIFGILLGRGNYRNHFARLMKLNMQVKSL